MNETPVVTNISAIVQPRACPRGGVTLVTIEASRPLRHVLETADPRRPVVRLPGAETRMPDGPIKIHDGLLDLIQASARDDGLCLTLLLAHCTALRMRSVPGIPIRLCLMLDRAPLWRILAGRRIAIDPGHGGKDTGGRGPIDLREKNMTLSVAHLLAGYLEDLGSTAILTRAADRALDWPERLAHAERERAEALVSLHTGWYSDPAVAGIRVGWLNRRGQDLARPVHAALRRKLPLPDRGIGPSEPAAGLAVPAVVVEFATISNPVEEGWLRSSTFLSRAAVAVANGVKDFFATDARPRRAAG